MDNIQEIVTKRIQAEIGNLIVQLTLKNVENEQLREENQMLKAELKAKGFVRPESGHVKEASNGNKQ